MFSSSRQSMPISALATLLVLLTFKKSVSLLLLLLFGPSIISLAYSISILTRCRLSAKPSRRDCQSKTRCQEQQQQQHPYPRHHWEEDCTIRTTLYKAIESLSLPSSLIPFPSACSIVCPYSICGVCRFDCLQGLSDWRATERASLERHDFICSRLRRHIRDRCHHLYR